MDNILVIGSSGHAKAVIDAVEQQGAYKIAGLLDPFRELGQQTLGYPILGDERNLQSLVGTHEISGLLVAIGDNYARGTVVAQVRDLHPQVRFVSAIHPRAYVSNSSSVGPGTVIMAGVAVNPCCSIGPFCILNTNSSIDHDSQMRSYSSLAPGVTAGGGCTIGEYSAICIGSSVCHNIEIGAHSIVGAGSTVIRDVGPHRVAYGTPAVEIRERREGEGYL